MKVRFDFRLCCRHAHNSAWILSASSLKYPRQHRACANWLRPYFDWRSNRLAYTALALSSAISVLVDPKLFTAEALPQRNVGPHRSGGSFWSGCPRASCHEKVAGLQLLLQLKKKTSCSAADMRTIQLGYYQQVAWSTQDRIELVQIDRDPTPQTRLDSQTN